MVFTCGFTCRFAEDGYLGLLKLLFYVRVGKIFAVFFVLSHDRPTLSLKLFHSSSLLIWWLRRGFEPHPKGIHIRIDRGLKLNEPIAYELQRMFRKFATSLTCFLSVAQSGNTIPSRVCVATRTSDFGMGRRLSRPL